MQVEDRLSGGLSDVDTNVVPVGRAKGFDRRPHMLDSSKQLSAFGICCVEPGGNVTDRDQQGVARADRKGVPNAVDEGAPKEDLLTFRCAKRTARWIQGDAAPSGATVSQTT